MRRYKGARRRSMGPGGVCRMGLSGRAVHGCRGRSTSRLVTKALTATASPLLSHCW